MILFLLTSAEHSSEQLSRRMLGYLFFFFRSPVFRIQAYPDALLATMIRQDRMVPGMLVDGAIFLDRDSACFREILRFYQKQHDYECDKGRVKLAMLLQEADYFLLHDMVAILKHQAQKVQLILKFFKRFSTVFRQHWPRPRPLRKQSKRDFAASWNTSMRQLVKGATNGWWIREDHSQPRVRSNNTRETTERDLHTDGSAVESR